MDYDEYYKLIHPWQVCYDDTWQRSYYFNPLSNESVWELPEETQNSVEKYYAEKFKKEGEIKKKNMDQFIPAKKVETQKVKQNPSLKTSYMDRPARKQVEQSLASQFAYKQGIYQYLLQIVFKLCLNLVHIAF